MTEAFPWSFKGIDHETRDVARAAARRSGKSLSAWLDDVIQEKANFDDRSSAVDDEEPSAPARRRALRSRLYGRNDRGRMRRDAAPRRDLRDEEPEDDFRSLAPRGRAEVDAKAIVDDAVALFERRSAESERKTANALSGLAKLIDRNHTSRARLGDDIGAVMDRLGRIEERIATTRPDEGVRPIRNALARLEARIDSLSNDDRAYEFENALGALDQRLAEIAARLDEEAEERRAAELRRRQEREKQERENSERERQERDSRQERERRAAARRPLAEAVAEITERQRALEDQAGGDFVARAAIEARPAIFDGLAESIESLSRQLMSARAEQSVQGEQQAAVVAQIDLLRCDLEGLSRALVDLAPRASVAAVESALRELTERVEAQRLYGVEEMVLAPVERLTADLASILRDLDPSRIVAVLYEEVRALNDKLAEHHAAGGADRAAIDAIAGETREIHELLKAVSRRPLPIEKLEAGIAALTTQVDEFSAGVNVATAKDVSELVQSIRSIVSTEIGGSFAALERRLEYFAAKLDNISTKSGGGKRFDEINERIEQVHKSLAARIERSGAGVDVDQVQQLFASFAKKIDAAAEAKIVHPVDELGRKIEKLEQRLHQPAAPTQQSADAEQLREIAKNMDELRAEMKRKRGGSGVDPNQFERLFASLAEKIDAATEARIVHPGFDELGRKIEKLEQRLQPVAAGAQKSAGSEQLRALAERIDHVHAELAARIDSTARRRADDANLQLAELVGQLAQKMDAALDPDADRTTFTALEAQIGRLAERLDRSDINADSFSAIERALGALATKVEETRSSTMRVAEIAAREAAQDALRDATALSGVPGGLQEALEKELSELRNFQDEAGHRTNQTLAAVHETLQRVVERLSMFEDELTNLRKAKPAAAEAPPRAAARVKPAAPVGDVEDMLLEPGERRPRREPTISRENDRSGSVQQDFIAAARRAAQQAAVDAQAAAAQGKAAQGKAAKKIAAEQKQEPERVAATGGGVGAALQSRRRPLLLGVGVLVLLYGAYQIARVTLDDPAPQASAIQAEPSEATASVPAEKSAPEAAAPAPSAKDAAAAEPSAPAAATSAPAALSAAEPAAKAPALSPKPLGVPSLAPGASGVGSFSPNPQAPAPGRFGAQTIDPLPVGAIGTPAATAPVTPRQDVFATIKEIAASGDAHAQYELGLRYAEGRGGAPRDPKLAFQWFEKAADKGFAPAQYRLGSIYEKGMGVERDYAKALSWYKRAADAGNARAMHNLAVLFAGGGDGKPDYDQAAQWFRKAAEYGVRDSQFNLAILCARGLGVPQNLAQAYLWFSAAAAQGDEDAGKKRDEVRARLDSKDMAAAKALVDGFRPKQPDSAANDAPPPPGGWENAKAPAKPEGKPVGKPKVSAL
ncbi:SEL1-like repeat protein [Methylosinus sp. RM1]|uniref:SEL1-like repeat protein n=1 Tax=Methylosinus sp. RM1 TaxID=2583817 RepID=UPI00140D1C78|nr:SEL1-like repeat protein [Methylosinus sp. RM1]